MADKEERILCLKVDDKDFVYLPNAKNYKVPEGIYNVIIGGSMTRQEAIERIKKSLKSIQCWPDSFNDSIAEVALNALLGVEK